MILQRTDILSGKEASEFARENTNYTPNYYTSGYALLKDNHNENTYYLANIELEKTRRGNVLGKLSQISVKPIQAENISMRISKQGVGVDVNADNETLYYNDKLYLFQNEADKIAFDMFCLEFDQKDAYGELDLILPYFKDENFVLMAKDKALDLAFHSADNKTTLGRNLLERKIIREISKRQEKANKLKPSSDSAEREF